MVRTQRPNNNKGIAHKETLLRINYMYQAAHLVLTQNPNNTELIRFYAYTLKAMAKKQVLRLHPDIKRTICKKCFMLLVPGVTATVRKKGKKQTHMVVLCLECQTPKRFPTRADYKLWAEQPLAWFSMFPPEAPLPVDSSNISHDGAAASDGYTKPACAHRRCRQLPRCKNELKKKRNTVKSSSLSLGEASVGDDAEAGLAENANEKAIDSHNPDCNESRVSTGTCPSPIVTELQNGQVNASGKLDEPDDTAHSMPYTYCVKDCADKGTDMESGDCDTNCDEKMLKSLKRLPIDATSLEVPNLKRPRHEEAIVNNCSR